MISLAEVVFAEVVRRLRKSGYKCLILLAEVRGCGSRCGGSTLKGTGYGA